MPLQLCLQTGTQPLEASGDPVCRSGFGQEPVQRWPKLDGPIDHRIGSGRIKPGLDHQLGAIVGPQKPPRLTDQLVLLVIGRIGQGPID